MNHSKQREAYVPLRVVLYSGGTFERPSCIGSELVVIDTKRVRFNQCTTRWSSGIKVSELKSSRLPRRLAVTPIAR